jgi:outer membrane protein assembly factor BamB
LPIHHRGRRILAAATLSCAVVALAAGAVSAADDWPQLWGPRVDAAVEAQTPPGAAGLRELWRRPIGSGFSGITVVGERGYTGESDGATDHAIAFDVRTGKTLWRAPLGETYRGHDGSRDGPISTPAVARGRVFLPGPRGTLIALDAASGRELWRKDLVGELKVKLPFYGFGASPIVAGDLVAVQVGSAEKSGLAAFDAATGALAWTAMPSETKGDSSGYTTAVPAVLGGESQLVVTAHDRVFAVRAADGSVAWTHPLGEAEEPTRSPLVLPRDQLLVLRGSGAILLKLARDGGAWKATEGWRTARIKGLSPTVHDNGSLFAFGGQYLLCLDAATGEPRWREKTNSGSLIRVGRQLVVLGDQSGLLRLADAAPAAYHELARTPAFNAGAQSTTGPSFAGGRIFVRNVEEMVAYWLGSEPVAEARP